MYNFEYINNGASWGRLHQLLRNIKKEEGVSVKFPSDFHNIKNSFLLIKLFSVHYASFRNSLRFCVLTVSRLLYIKKVSSTSITFYIFLECNSKWVKLHPKESRVTNNCSNLIEINKVAAFWSFLIGMQLRDRLKIVSQEFQYSFRDWKESLPFVKIYICLHLIHPDMLRTSSSNSK